MPDFKVIITLTWSCREPGLWTAEVSTVPGPSPLAQQGSGPTRLIWFTQGATCGT